MIIWKMSEPLRADIFLFFQKGMEMEVIEITLAQLPDYATLSIGFWVQAQLQVEPLEGGLGGLQLREVPVAPAYYKDYDVLGSDAGPTGWPRQFDVTHWGFFLAVEAGAVCGGAAVAFNTGGVWMLEGRPELAVLWDIRVQPQLRRQGVGQALFRQAQAWALARGARQLKVETQNINLAACRFYARMGCHLGQIHRYAYAGEPGCEQEVMLCWYLDLM